jgi:hypothetical protein
VVAIEGAATRGVRGGRPVGFAVALRAGVKGFEPWYCFSCGMVVLLLLVDRLPFIGPRIMAFVSLDCKTDRAGYGRAGVASSGDSRIGSRKLSWLGLLQIFLLLLLLLLFWRLRVFCSTEAPRRVKPNSVGLMALRREWQP